MTQFKVVWIFKDNADGPKEYQMKADTAFDAERGFLRFADIFTRPVRVLRVERMSL